jgi:hypothetical protein
VITILDLIAIPAHLELYIVHLQCTQNEYMYSTAALIAKVMHLA